MDWFGLLTDIAGLSLAFAVGYYMGARRTAEIAVHAAMEAGVDGEKFIQSVRDA